jgi:hypothetical protein
MTDPLAPVPICGHTTTGVIDDQLTCTRPPGHCDHAAPNGTTWNDGLDAVNTALRDAGINYPTGARGVRDLAMQRNTWPDHAAEMVKNAKADLISQIAAALQDPAGLNQWLTDHGHATSYTAGELAPLTGWLRDRFAS